MPFSALHPMFGLACRGGQARLVLARHHQVLVPWRQLSKLLRSKEQHLRLSFDEP